MRTCVGPQSMKLQPYCRGLVALYWRSIGRRFSPRPHRCRTATIGKSFTYKCLCSPVSINWYRPRSVTLWSWEGNRGPGLTKSNGSHTAEFMSNVTCRCLPSNRLNFRGYDGYAYPHFLKWGYRTPTFKRYKVAICSHLVHNCTTSSIYGCTGVKSPPHIL